MTVGRSGLRLSVMKHADPISLSELLDATVVSHFSFSRVRAGVIIIRLFTASSNRWCEQTIIIQLSAAVRVTCAVEFYVRR